MLGLVTGLYITSVRFRGKVNRVVARFTQWVKNWIERNKKIRQQEEELRILKSSSFKVKINKEDKDGNN